MTPFIVTLTLLWYSFYYSDLGPYMDKEMIPVLGGTKQDSKRFHHAVQNSGQLKRHELFISGVLHLPFSDCDWPMTREQTQSWTRRGYCIPYEIIWSTFLCKISFNWLPSTSLSASYKYKKRRNKEKLFNLPPLKFKLWTERSILLKYSWHIKYHCVQNTHTF